MKPTTPFWDTVLHTAPEQEFFTEESRRGLKAMHFDLLTRRLTAYIRPGGEVLFQVADLARYLAVSESGLLARMKRCVSPENCRKMDLSFPGRSRKARWVVNLNGFYELTAKPAFRGAVSLFNEILLPDIVRCGHALPADSQSVDEFNKQAKGGLLCLII